MNKYKLIRHRDFDLAYGTEHIWYTLHEYRKTLFGNVKWKPVKSYHFDMGGGSNSPVSGGIEWAKSVAKELGIGVPKQ